MRTLVIGGTGMVGGEVARRLVARGEGVRVLTSHPGRPRPTDGEDVAYGNLDEPTSLRAALVDMDRVFLLVPQGPREAAQGLAAGAEARAAGVSRIVYMGVRLPDWATEVPHFASKMVIEEAVRGSGVPFTVLHSNNFFQNDLAFAEVIARHGVYPQPIGSRGVARVDVRDIADAAAIVLTSADHAGETYELNGPDSLTGEAVADAYTRHLERPVRYAGDSLDAWAAAVSQTLPAWLVGDLRWMYEKFQQHGLPSTPQDDERLRKLLGRPQRGFEEFAAELAAASVAMARSA